MLKVIFFQTIFFFFFLALLMSLLNLIYFKFYAKVRGSEENVDGKNLISLLFICCVGYFLMIFLIKALFIFLETSLLDSSIEYATSNAVPALCCLVVIIAMHLSLVTSYIFNAILLKYYYRPIKVSGSTIVLVFVLLVLILFLGRDNGIAISKEKIEFKQARFGVLIKPINELIEIEKTENHYLLKFNSLKGIEEYFLPIKSNLFMGIIEDHFEEVIAKKGVALKVSQKISVK